MEENKQDKKEELKVDLSSEKEDERVEENKEDTFVESEEKKEVNKKFKDLLSLVIVFAGVAIGSMFFDVAQFFSKDGYSERALNNTNIFVQGEKTWVAFDEPLVKVIAIGVDEEGASLCPACDAGEIVLRLKQVIPTATVENIDYQSAQGKDLIRDLGLNTVPTLLFDKAISDTTFYQEGASVIFEQKGDYLAMNLSAIGAPIGRYLASPQIEEKDPVLGRRGAPVEIIVYSDFQCPFCSQYFDQITKLVQEYGDQVALTYKEFPLNFHAQAENAAKVAICANEQGKFWEMAGALYGNQNQWQETEGLEAFDRYVRNLALDMEQYSSCLENPETAVKIEEDMEEGSSFGVSGTPATFIGGEFLSGLVQDTELRSIIDQQLVENASVSPEDSEIEEEELIEE